MRGSAGGLLQCSVTVSRGTKGLGEMSNRMECPGCGVETSSVRYAFENENPCPNCGLSASAALEIITVQITRASAKVKELHKEAVKSRDEWASRALKAENTIRQIKWAIEDASND